MAFEYYPKNMENEIRERVTQPAAIKGAKTYSEPEIWYILEMMSGILTSFKNRGYHHGDIQPKNLMIDPHGFIKITDNSLINYGETGYSKMIMTLTESKYRAALSPKLMESLPFKELNPNHDAIKSDMFSLGITALIASLNENLDTYYDWRKPAIRFDAIHRGLKKMGDLGFSQQLINTLEGLLTQNEIERTGCEQLANYIKANKRAISAGAFDQMQHANQGQLSQSASFNPALATSQPNQSLYGDNIPTFQSQEIRGPAIPTQPAQPISQPVAQRYDGPAPPGGFPINRGGQDPRQIQSPAAATYPVQNWQVQQPSNVSQQQPYSVQSQPVIGQPASPAYQQPVVQQQRPQYSQYPQYQQNQSAQVFNGQNGFQPTAAPRMAPITRQQPAQQAFY